ncbi:MAG: hypothetical protein M9894_10320 [Planctomycetes bacterium]|nr:hypothetical protein [Planctomycetota bacterium]
MSTIHEAAAHLVLPALVFAEPARTARRLTGPEKGAFLGKDLWRLAAKFADDEADDVDLAALPPKGASAWVERVADVAAVVVRFPSPRQEGEAHAAVIVPTRNRWLPFLPGGARYFTLERTFDERGRAGTAIGEWTGEWIRVDFGPGPQASDKDGFLDAIERVLAGTRRPEGAAPRPVPEHVLRIIERAA